MKSIFEPMTVKVGGLTLAIAMTCGLSPSASGQDVDVATPRGQVEVEDEGLGGEDVEVRVQSDRRRGTDRARAMNASLSNRQLANWLLVDQRQIVDLAKYGLDRSKSPEVRQLAETVIQDHQDFSKQLRQVNAGDRNDDQAADESDQRRDRRRNLLRNRGEADGREGRDALEGIADRIESGVDRLANRAERVVEETRDAVERNVADVRRRPGGAAAAGWLAIHRDISQRWSQAVRNDLENRDGYEFDAAFVGVLVAAHLKEQAVLEVLRDHADGDLKSTLDQALATTMQHRQSAEQVMQSIKR
ncbi:DUF4142 domain-containing protein [Roseiconus nitratireducens]|uniref:DUF4142 domain-containing protein n=1 Tax=Roseiconus nitratireducens TaxID=2605748 RepID=A0A5M6D538_9BACT|nr:DUF4142 domain-containing protein [Roseiconus nitratireducens]KAA5542604.1 DUF4142 domain-containing protein [Roseiconus nitratireducens]